MVDTSVLKQFTVKVNQGSGLRLINRNATVGTLMQHTKCLCTYLNCWRCNHRIDIEVVTSSLVQILKLLLTAKSYRAICVICRERLQLSKQQLRLLVAEVRHHRLDMSNGDLRRITCS